MGNVGEAWKVCEAISNWWLKFLKSWWNFGKFSCARFNAGKHLFTSSLSLSLSSFLDAFNYLSAARTFRYFNSRQIRLAWISERYSTSTAKFRVARAVACLQADCVAAKLDSPRHFYRDFNWPERQLINVVN